MKRLLPLAGVVLALTLWRLGAGAAAPDAPVRFRPISIYVESDAQLAAYQVEIRVKAGSATFLGVEGGEAPLDEPPFYDPRALSEERIVIAAFDLDAALEPGRHRVALLHVREAGAEVRYEAVLVAAADLEAQRVAGRAEVVPGEVAR